MHFDPAQLAALTTILRHGSFDAAAQVLGVTASAISQRIKALEDRLGGPVLMRLTPATATPLGARLAAHAHQVALLEADLARDLEKPARAIARIAVNADSLDTWFLPALANLPFEIDVVVDDQTRSADWLRRGEVTAAVTAQASPIQGCDVIALGALRYFATASPSFYARWFPNGPTLGALSQAPMLRYSQQDRLQHDWAETLSGRPITPPLFTLPTTRGFVDACILGVGWGLNPAPLLATHFQNGALRRVAKPHWDIPLYWQVSRIVAPTLNPLTSAVRAKAKRHLVAP